MSFTLTPSAEKFVRRMLRFSSGVSGFRLAVTPGGCSGLSAEFDVAEAPRAGDGTVSVGDIKFFLPAESRILLDGVTVDFKETPTENGFVFHDPKGTSCGCSSEAEPASKAPAGLHQLREL
jgi:iron-sulfur cluster assembly accessory protein